MIALLLALIASTTSIPRTVDVGLQNAAQIRADTVVCADPVTFFHHQGHPPGVDEILICFSDPNATIQQAVSGWMASAPHRAVLVNSQLGYVGCGVHRSASGSMFACELANHAIPNTSLDEPMGWFSGSGVLLLIAAFAMWRRRRRCAEWRPRGE